MVQTLFGNLTLDLIAENQEDKEVTANEDIARVDLALTNVAAVTVSDAGDTTLTLEESEQAMLLQLIGSLTAARTVITFNTTKKLFIVHNDTDDGTSPFDSGSGEDVTFKTSAGTGIVVIPGAKVLLYCDGTNIITAL